MGAYCNPNQRGLPRPQLPQIPFNAQLHSTYIQSSKENIHPEIVEWADVVVMMHNSRVDVVDHPQPWLGSTRQNSSGMTENNWDKIKHKPVVWRSIGQSVSSIEDSLRPFREQGLKIVRYSPREEKIPGFVGSDALIRFYKDEEEYQGWSGEVRKVITIAQDMKNRNEYCHFDTFMQATEGFQRNLYGRGNDNAMDVWGGSMTHQDLIKELRRNAVYFYTGTTPASYTLAFMEAMMTGIPIVSIGPKLWNKTFPDHDLFEIPDIIQNGVNGFWSDDIPTLKGYIADLLNDEALAKRISAAGRERAIQLFGKETIKDQWTRYLESLL